MATLQIVTIPIGSQLTSAIDTDEPADKNDFTVLFIWSENVTGFRQGDISVLNGGELVAFEGKNAVYEGTVRPPETAAEVIISVRANAVAEGNASFAKTVRVSTRFPDVDVESPSELFSHTSDTGSLSRRGLAVTKDRIILNASPHNNNIQLEKWTHDGVQQSSETVSGSHSNNPYFYDGLAEVNGDFVFSQSRYRQIGTRLKFIEGFRHVSESTSLAGGGNIVWTPLGFMEVRSTLRTYDGNAEEEVVEHPMPEGTPAGFGAYADGFLYLASPRFAQSNLAVVALTEENVFSFVKHLNVDIDAIRDLDIYRDTLYLLKETTIDTLDLKKYRPVATRTKTTIYPVFAKVGDIIALSRFSPDAERIVFDVGYEKPAFLTMLSRNRLQVGAGASTCFVKLKAINQVDATETGTFGFYVVVRATDAPVWRDVSALTLRAGSGYDLFQLVDAESIAFRSGEPPLAGSSLENGVFTIGTTGGTAHFTATAGGTESHIAIAIDVVQELSAAAYTEAFRYRVEIEGVDITADLVGTPTVSETLDPVVINEYRVNEASIVLRNEGGKYTGNFWTANGLNVGGFQNTVKVYTEHYEGGRWVESLLFAGIVLESFAPVQGDTFRMNCADISYRLRNNLAQDFGSLAKWEALRQQSDEDSFEGVYVPDRSLTPMVVSGSEAWSHQTELTISGLELQSEGPPEENTAYMTPNEFRTAGGFLETAPLVRFKSVHRSEDVRSLISQLVSMPRSVYAAEVSVPGVSVERPFYLNRGSLAFGVEPTRTTRLPVDWVYDETHDRILILLSSREAHIADVLVQYDIGRDTSRVLYTFPQSLRVHRIERASGTEFYLLTSQASLEDGSRLAGGVSHTERQVSAYDSRADGSRVRIHHYDAATHTLTEQVTADDTHPPQLGIHYGVGFENGLNTWTDEGVRPGYRGAFKCVGDHLYYRYAKDSEFGVARVNASGTTARRIREPMGEYQDGLNFAFDVTDAGTVYFAYVDGTTYRSRLIIKSRGSDGTTETVLTETQELDSEDFVFQGVHEALYHDGFLYLLVPTHPVISDGRYFRELERGTVEAGDTVIQWSGNSASSRTYEPGDEIGFTFIWNRRIAGATSRDWEVTGGRITRFQAFRNVVLQREETRFRIALAEGDKLQDVTIVIPEDFHGTNPEQTIRFSFYERDTLKSGGMTLYRCNVTDANPRLTEIETWDFVQRSGCNLTVHDGAVHFTEYPPESQVFKPYNPELESYNEEMGYNVLPEPLGALKKIDSGSREIEDLGNVWYTDRPYNVFPMRMLRIGEDLHICAGYGNPDTLLRFNSLASGAGNMAHIVYSRQVRYIVPSFSPVGSIYSALADIAKKVNATLSFEKNIIMITDRHPFRAVLDGDIGTGASDIGFRAANKTFPASGYLLIGGEVLRYSGLSGSQFTGIVRGVLGSGGVGHSDGSDVLYLDTLLGGSGGGSPYKAITVQSDTNRIYNIIRDASGFAEARDAESIARYGERPYTLELGLTRHEKRWSESVFKAYLEELKDLQEIVNVQVVPDFSVRLGQIVPFAYAGELKAMRIVSIRYEADATHIRGRTVS